MSKLVHGVGINDRSRPSNIGGKGVKEYNVWRSMIERCFSEKCQAKHPTYKGCSVSNNFLNYTFFYEWCQKQIGFGNIDEKGRIWQLDKDLLINGNKIYSENTCVFVPHEINSFFTDCGAKRGGSPVGVYFHKASGKYAVRCSTNGKLKHLGRFDTAEEAFTAYKPFKEALCKELALKWQPQIDPRVFDAMMKWEVNYETPTNI